MHIVVVLAVQWGYPGDKPERWFHINPYNHSGRRLIGLIGHWDFKVTNACSDIVFRASDRGTPDSKWLRANLRVLRPRLVLVCGSVAQSTFERSMVDADTRVLRLPHPAARTWTKAMIKRWAKRIQRCQEDMYEQA
jgi:uracil-DNA glycosylase